MGKRPITASVRMLKKRASVAAPSKARKLDASDLIRALRTDFERFPPPPGVSSSDAFGVFALSIFIDEPDRATLMSDAVTGGADDKKADFIYLDRENERAYIGQSYLAGQWGRQAAPANKAGTLATAVSWLISTPLSDLPPALRQKAADLRQGIDEATITKLLLVYAHNCHEHVNVRSELSAAAHIAKAACGAKVTVTAHELGLMTIGRLFEALEKDILVVDAVDFQVEAGSYETTGPTWSAISTRVKGSYFHDLYKKHGNDLFSANIRSYLGLLKKTKGNINADIKSTIEADPENFWVFNNGVTVLTNEYGVAGDRLTVEGVSVINGAQTTGVLGDCSREDADRTLVPCRFVRCSDPSTIRNIITFNNTQNTIKSFDLRSNDPVQRTLATEFEHVGIKYIHRRDASRRAPANSIHVETVGQGLASLNGQLQVAIRQRSSIFADRALYDSLFPRQIEIGHVYLVQSLLDAIDDQKRILRNKKLAKEATPHQSRFLDLLEHSTAKQFMMLVVGGVASQLMGRTIESLLQWRAKPEHIKIDRSELRDAWMGAVTVISPCVLRAVGTSAQSAVRSQDTSIKVVAAVAEFLDAHGDSFDVKFRSLRQMTTTV